MPNDTAEISANLEQIENRVNKLIHANWRGLNIPGEAEIQKKLINIWHVTCELQRKISQADIAAKEEA